MFHIGQTVRARLMEGRTEELMGLAKAVYRGRLADGRQGSSQVGHRLCSPISSADFRPRWEQPARRSTLFRMPEAPLPEAFPTVPDKGSASCRPVHPLHLTWEQHRLLRTVFDP